MQSLLEVLEPSPPPGPPGLCTASPHFLDHLLPRHSASSSGLFRTYTAIIQKTPPPNAAFLYLPPSCHPSEGPVSGPREHLSKLHPAPSCATWPSPVCRLLWHQSMSETARPGWASIFCAFMLFQAQCQAHGRCCIKKSERRQGGGRDEGRQGTQEKEGEKGGERQLEIFLTLQK